MGRFRFMLRVKFLFFGALLVSVFGWVTMFTWNYVMPHIFGLPFINYWEALALLILARLLFWRGGGWHRGGGHGWHEHAHGWKGRMKERWENMTPEQRERVKSYWKNRCGYSKKY